MKWKGLHTFFHECKIDIRKIIFWNTFQINNNHVFLKKNYQKTGESRIVWLRFHCQVSLSSYPQKLLRGVDFKLKSFGNWKTNQGQNILLWKVFSQVKTKKNYYTEKDIKNDIYKMDTSRELRGWEIVNEKATHCIIFIVGQLGLLLDLMFPCLCWAELVRLSKYLLSVYC